MPSAPRDRWEEIERVLDAALGLPTAERAAYLDEACADDSGLRAEVERMLNEMSTAEGFLTEPAAAHLAALVFEVARGETPEPGSRFGGYEITRLLGRGGMAAVYVARDTRYGRDVALKLLRPDLAVLLGPDRFLQEIRITAQLSHPHILTLIESGSENGALWYVMPLVSGESLREKLHREVQLGVTEAVRIARQVASALDYAHRRGVIHRDIKPENILLHEGEAVLADFGIARAVQQAGGPRLTNTGELLGTPQYMSPEQAMGDRELDPRTDIFSLGVVLYEMLAGEPPHTGRTVQAITAKLLTEVPVPIRTLRPTIPDWISPALDRALAKVPADRFESAGAMLRALESEVAEAPAPAAPPATDSARPPSARGHPWWPWVLASLVTLAALGYALKVKRPTAPLDPNLVAVLPFRIAGAEPSLHYLREGMIDLLAAKLTGEGGGLRASDPRTVTSAWRRVAGPEDRDLTQDAAVGVARGLGAGRLLVGGVVGSPAHMVLSATLLTLPSGRASTQGSVEGPADSLPAMLDRLIGALLVKSSGLSSTRQASLTTTSLAALQAYLDGRADYRRGDYQGAVGEFNRALALDSGFALAAVDLAQANAWLSVFAGPDTTRVQLVAWHLRDRLSTRDRAILEAALGPHFPDQPLEADRLAAQERAVGLAPDDPDAWFLLGDEYFHLGGYLGHTDWAERARIAFERASTLDPAFVAPLGHLIDLATLRHDTATTRSLARRYLARTPAVGEGNDLAVRWDIARTLGDSAVMREFWTRYESTWDLSMDALQAQAAGADSTTVDRMLRASRRLAATPIERGIALGSSSFTEWNRGHPGRAIALTDSFTQIQGLPRDPTIPIRALQVVQALFAGADSALGTESAAHLAQLVDGPLGTDPIRRYHKLYGTCVLGLWSMARGHLAEGDGAINRLRSVTSSQDPLRIVRPAGVCADLLEAVRATAQHRPDAKSRVERLDSLMRLGPVMWAPFMHFENLVLGQLFGALGDPARGLAAVQRGGYWNGALFLLAAYLREEGRLAAQAGDREGAIRAYQHYLALRPDPEPSVKPEVEAVRAELAALVAER